MALIVDPTFPPDTQSPTLGASDIRALTAEILQLFGFNGLSAETLTYPPFASLDTTTGLLTVQGPPTVANGIATMAYAQSAGFASGTTTGGTTAYAVTLSNAPSSLAGIQGQPIFVLWNAANTGATTLNPNSLGGTPVRKYANGSIVELQANDIEANYSILTYDGTQFILLGILNQVRQLDGGGGARGLIGSSPGSATTLTLAAQLLILRPASASGALTLPGFSGGATVDISVTGPALNGRDQSAAFSNGSTVHVYGISGPGVTTGLIASLTYGTPTLPTGYTNAGYLMSFIMSGADIPALFIDGSKVYYAAQQSVLSAGQATSETNISLASVVPANALSALVQLEGSVTTSAGVNFNQGALNIRLLTGDDFYIMKPWGYSAGAHIMQQEVIIEVPNNLSSQNLIYLWSSTPNAVGFGASAWVTGYTVPNAS
jgi:hypothetical protein